MRRRRFIDFLSLVWRPLGEQHAWRLLRGRGMRRTISRPVTTAKPAIAQSAILRHQRLSPAPSGLLPGCALLTERRRFGFSAGRCRGAAAPLEDCHELDEGPRG